MSVQSQASEATVRVHEQSDMGVGNKVEGVVVIESPGTTLRGPARYGGQNGLPAAKFGVGYLLISQCRPIRDLKLSLFSKVAHKVRCVNLDALYGASSDSQLDHHPIVRIRVMTSRFPPIIPGARVHKHSRTVNWCTRSEKVGSCSKIIIGTSDDSAVQRGRSKVGSVGKDLVNVLCGNEGDGPGSHGVEAASEQGIEVRVHRKWCIGEGIVERGRPRCRVLFYYLTREVVRCFLSDRPASGDHRRGPTATARFPGHQLRALHHMYKVC